MNEKKSFYLFLNTYGSVLKVVSLLMLAFVLLMISSSTCFASNTLDFVTVDFWTAVENHFLSLSTIDSKTKDFLNNAYVTPINLQNTFELHKQDFIDYMTSNNLEDRNLLLLCCSSSSMLRLVFVPNNNTIGNSADFMIIAKDRNYLMIDTTVFNPTCYSITFYQGALSSSLRTLENCRQFSTGSGWSEYSGVTVNSITLSTDNNNFLIAPNLLGLNAQALNVVEYKNHYSDTTSSPKFLYYYIDFTTVNSPDEPSGDDSSGETFPGGTIINPSGEVTGRVDLTNIENGIYNINQNLNIIENKIPSSGDMQSILSGETSKITNTLTNYSEDVGEDGINSIVSNISDTMSGELSNNEIFGALDTAEQGFFDIISGNGGDFVISWNDVVFYGVNLIPAGSVNFSQICRDNQALGTVKNYINIILTAFCTFGLFKYLYNLFLATFGIDNPYLYEKNTDCVSNPSIVDTTKRKVIQKNGNMSGWGRS